MSASNVGIVKFEFGVLYMIQIRRGKTLNLRADPTLLADGQPGYDREKHKIKIGDGKTPWILLPYASGLKAEEILNSELKAKARLALDSEDITIITYDDKAPDKDTVGQLYLQYYDSDPEVDYVVSSGVNGIWTFQKWNSGIAKCWGTLSLTTGVQNAFENAELFYDNNTMKKVKYPFAFKSIPSETATLQSPGGVAWLASRACNTASETSLYSIISPDKLSSATYKISLQVEGYWK
jgi:hypothetical protein